MKVEDRGPHWDKMAPRWHRAGSLLAGTEEMRRAEQTYLPMFPAESDTNYQRRLSMATLTNFYRKSAYGMIGNIFREEMAVDSGLPEEILEDIDRRGTNIHKFAQDLAFSLLTNGVQSVMVDHPEVKSPLTFKDELDGKIRPYAFMPKADSIIAVYEQLVNGEAVPIYVSRFEPRLALTDEGYKFFQDIIVIERDLETGATVYRLYQQNAEGGEYSATADKEGPITFPRVPLVIGYSNPLERETTYCCRPMLDDIAFKNIQHWQFASSQDNILELSAFPEKVLKTTDPEQFKEMNTIRDPASSDPTSMRYDPTSKSGAMPIGPHLMRIIGIEDSLEYISAPMDGVEARSQRLQEMIDDAQIMALDLVTGRPNPTATGRVLDKLESLSPLQRVAAEVESVINKTLSIIAEWRGRGEEGGTVTINKDFGVTAEDSLQITALRDAFAVNAITQKTYLKGLKKLASVLSDMDIDREILDTEDGANGPTLGDDDGGDERDDARRAVSRARNRAAVAAR